MSPETKARLRPPIPPAHTSAFLLGHMRAAVASLPYSLPVEASMAEAVRYIDARMEAAQVELDELVQR